MGRTFIREFTLIQKSTSLVWSALLTLAFLFAAFSSALADLVITQDGLKYSGVMVESYHVHPGGAVFTIRTIVPGAFESEAYPVEISQIASIEFRSNEDFGEKTPGRSATVVMLNGQALEGTTVEGFKADNGSFTFYMREPGVPPGGVVHPISVGQLFDIVFKPEPINAAYVQMPKGTQPAPQAPPNNQPSPISQLPTPADDEGEWDYDSSLADEAMGFGDFETDEDYEYGYAFDDDSSSFPSSGSRAGRILIPFVGIGVGILSFLLYLVVTTVTGGVYLFLASRVENVNDFPLWKSFITAAALAVFPMLFFLLCARFVPWGMGCGPGLVVMYFTARAIVMGAMEILEEKANSVLFTFILIQVGVLFGFSYFL